MTVPGAGSPRPARSEITTPTSTVSSGVVVAGLGSSYRRDDAAGPLVAACAAHVAGAAVDVGPLVDPLDLLGRWDGAHLAVVVDAVRSGAPPGTIHLIELEAGDDACSAPGQAPCGTSTHGIGLAGVLRLARAVGHAPQRVVVVGIEGADFGRGTGLSPAVGAALPAAVRAVVGLIETAGGLA